MATPTGQQLVWQAWAWMQPTENMKPRAEFAQSAPSASTLAISNEVTSLPGYEFHDSANPFKTFAVLPVESRYRFMLDYVQILRAVADFDVLLMPDGIERWYQDIHAYFLERGMQ